MFLIDSIPAGLDYFVRAILTLVQDVLRSVAEALGPSRYYNKINSTCLSSSEVCHGEQQSILLRISLLSAGCEVEDEGNQGPEQARSYQRELDGGTKPSHLRPRLSWCPDEHQE